MSFDLPIFIFFAVCILAIALIITAGVVLVPVLIVFFIGYAIYRAVDNSSQADSTRDLYDKTKATYPPLEAVEEQFYKSLTRNDAKDIMVLRCVA